MKKLIGICILACSFCSAIWASNSCKQHLTKEEFRAKQQAYIVEKAGLTAEEAAAFFPVYFELQDRKKQLNDEAWNLIKKGKKGDLEESQYEEILEGVYDSRISADRLDKTYFDKFKEILSFKKIYLVQRAEMRFHRELLKEMRKQNNSYKREQKK